MKEFLKKYWENLGISNEVIKAFLEVPREEFLLQKYKKIAYEDIALPSFKGQTISQPTTIAIMLNALELKKGETILEIGTGTGYNATLIAKIIGSKGKVYTTEIVKELVGFAKKNLKRVKIKNVEVIYTTELGIEGKKFDKIIVTAACSEIPENLLKQLKKRGIMVVPVGPRFGQKMLKIKKNKKLEIKDLGAFVFVPLIGKHGY
ncbi:MAG: protein-L-isoaspartate(D-aspartate) O-methyltransferase [Nanoarchaeota archaeon]|nr:protein-L-isoaspartate(D-aspartate) O-methyltransferase [Nanoarchaeota archaeon]MBU1444732.1 protein-L-isoaspartate(D-aspartate) O-methyltransferase [Nanoarchaeota archaeon]MBU2420772.1 protein-L-isoaspartate(D-aspartate) O-methyltransferase [Nanoarchaeota archaeon]MBU2475828.1 protein-L-isoaspartate(D-aspartate) O-methyltransferase [Nanoarchaeota archaeon]